MHNYKYKILESSEQNILTLDDVKNYTRISTNNDDKLLTSMVNSAISMAENFIKISLVKKTIEVEVSDSSNIRLPFMPVMEIVRVTANDEEVASEDVEIEGDVLNLSKHIECKKLKVIYSATVVYSAMYDVVSIDGDSLKIAACTRPDNFFDGGKLVFDDGSSYEIRSHIRGGITLIKNCDKAAPQRAILTPGCDKNFVTCCNKYNNAINFRGEPGVK